MLGFFLLFLAGDLLIIGLAIPLIRRRVRPNPWYGLRIPATLRDERVWFEANAASGRDFLGLGVAHAAVALGLPLTGISSTTYAVANATLLVVGVLTVAVVGIVRANRLRARGEADADVATG